MYLVVLSEADVRRNNALYREYRTLKMEDGWYPGDKEDVYKRLLRITRFAKCSIKNASVADVGCGTGDLCAYLKKRRPRSYTGVDILGSAVCEARLKYPDELFFHQDILSQPFKTKYDFVFCSGALSTKLATDNYLFLEAMIRATWKAAGKGLVFNFLLDEDSDPDPDLFFYGAKKVLEICKKIAPNALIKLEKNKDHTKANVYMVPPSVKP